MPDGEKASLLQKLAEDADVLKTNFSLFQKELSKVAALKIPISAASKRVLRNAL